ncbi:MAG: hypothetical protein Q7S84_04855 [bacterium]|nr:hypothetical protein [bacterium]
MESRRLVCQTVGERTVRLGLSGVAVLSVFVGTITERFLVLPEYGESIGRVYDRVTSRKRVTVSDMLEELEELTGFRIRMIMHRLERKGLLRRVGKRGYKATRDGVAFVRSIERQSTERQLWDGKWRLVAFDIPESRSEMRHWLRYALREAGYRKLQQSMYVGKLPLPGTLYREIDHRSLTPNVRLLTIGEIDEDIETLIGPFPV